MNPLVPFETTSALGTGATYARTITAATAHRRWSAHGAGPVPQTRQARPALPARMAARDRRAGGVPDRRRGAAPPERGARAGHARGERQGPERPRIRAGAAAPGAPEGPARGAEPPRPGGRRPHRAAPALPRARSLARRRQGPAAEAG